MKLWDSTRAEQTHENAKRKISENQNLTSHRSPIKPLKINTAAATIIPLWDGCETE
jgi:hypothetical protein